MFETAPHLTDLFPFGSDLSNPMFTAHALNVMNAVDFAVQNLDNADVLIPRLQELGRVHAFFQLTNIEFGVRFAWFLDPCLFTCMNNWF